MNARWDRDALTGITRMTGMIKWDSFAIRVKSSK